MQRDIYYIAVIIGLFAWFTIPSQHTETVVKDKFEDLGDGTYSSESVSSSDEVVVKKAETELNIKAIEQKDNNFHKSQKSIIKTTVKTTGTTITNQKSDSDDKKGKFVIELIENYGDSAVKVGNAKFDIADLEHPWSYELFSKTVTTNTLITREGKNQKSYTSVTMEINGEKVRLPVKFSELTYGEHPNRFMWKIAPSMSLGVHHLSSPLMYSDVSVSPLQFGNQDANPKYLLLNVGFGIDIHNNWIVKFDPLAVNIGTWSNVFVNSYLTVGSSFDTRGVNASLGFRTLF